MNNGIRVSYPRTKYQDLNNIVANMISKEIKENYEKFALSERKIIIYFDQY